MTRSLEGRAEVAAAGLPPLLVRADRVAHTVAQGVHGRRRVGTGETFWQFRQYQPGDTPASIDWRQSAKRDHVFVREYEWEAAQSIWLWRDASPSMSYSSGRDLPTKPDRAELLAVALAGLMVRAGERVARLDGNERPASGRLALIRLATGLTKQAETSTGIPARANLPRHARVVMFGDFLDPLEQTAAAVRGLSAQGVDGHLMQITDPVEDAWPFAGRVQFNGLEGEASQLVGRAETLRQAYRERLQQHRAGLQGICDSCGWSFGLHRTDHSPESALMALFVRLGQRSPR
ncbi:DUF58 domain-containing protein [Alphaproteobacteria bacterium HT1-32]|nr:DUF58 domain-containing protein [Alphaproteobacteria bacterium HT1-32]